MVENTAKHAIGETVGAIANKLGVSAEGVVYGVAGTVVGLGAMKLAKKLPLPNNSKKPKSISNNKNSNTEVDNVDSHHGKPLEDNLKYSAYEIDKSRASVDNYNKDLENNKATYAQKSTGC